MRNGGMVLVCATLLAAACAVGQADNPSTTRPAKAVTDKDSGKTVSLVKGEELLVSLPVQTGTGFTWQVTTAPAKLLKQQGEPKLEREKDARPGAPAQLVFRFQAQAEGEGEVKMVYRRPFGKDVKLAKSFQIKVHVKAAP